MLIPGVNWANVPHVGVNCVHKLQDWRFDPGVRVCQNVLEQDTEPQVAPDGQASALHVSSAAIGVSV